MKFFSVMYQTSNSKGQELLAQRMVKYALKLGHEAWLITSVYHDGEEVVPPRIVDLSEKSFVIFKEDPKVKIPTIRVSSARTTWPPRRIFFREFINILRRIDSDLGIDFIVTHSTLWNGPEEVSRWILWKRLVESIGEPVNKTVYAHMSHYQPPDPTRYSPSERAFRMVWNTTAFPSIFRAADLIICLTDIESRDMISMGASRDKIFLFPGGLDDEEASLIDNADPRLIREKFKIPEDKLIVAYLGTVEVRKNPLAVVRVARRLRDLRDVVFVIAGKPGDQWESVVREARGLDNVVLTGELPTELKASLIKASYINIIMSRLEAFGLTQLEFMYGGVPVITSASYGQKWLIRDGVDGIHVRGPEDIDGAAKAVRELVLNPSKRDEMSRNARERAKNFLMSKLMKELLDKASRILEMKR
jgi:glycosyltransferase involved in cell wall biosynthesis